MSDMKCPFCQQELLLSSLRDGDEEHLMWYCLSCQLSAQGKLWQELIRTRKALNIALDWLEQVATPAKCDDELCREFTKRKLIEIKTALEQKD